MDWVSELLDAAAPAGQVAGGQDVISLMVLLLLLAAIPMGPAEPAAARAAESMPPTDPSRSSAIVVGYGPVGRTLVRLLQENGIQPTVIELNLDTVRQLRSEGVRAIYGDATEIFVLELAGLGRPPDILVAVTGDDEDNIVICQLAREKYGVGKVVARVNDPRNQPHFDLLAGQAPPAGIAGLEAAGDEPLSDTLARVEAWLIRSALDRNAGHRSETARRLGLTREGLYKKMKRFHVA